MRHPCHLPLSAFASPPTTTSVISGNAWRVRSCNPRTCRSRCSLVTTAPPMVPSTSLNITESVTQISSTTIGMRRKKGAGGNLEYLARTARGKYIAHLDGDDFWLPQKLRAQIAFLEAHGDAPAAYTNAFCILDSGLPLGVFSNFSGQRINATDLVRRGNFLHHSSLIYRASFLEDLFYRGSPLLDYHFHLRLSRHGALAYLPTPFTVYRVSSSTSILVHSNDYVRELYWKTLSDTAKPLVTPADLSAGMAEFMRSIFFRSIRLRSFHLIANWWPRILRNAPLGKAKLLAQAGWSIFRVGMREAVSSVCGKIVGNKMRILYPK
jgi:hypothetical protein